MTAITSGWEQVNLGDKEMGLYVSAPVAPGPHPAVLVLQEIFGVDGYIRRMADRVAAAGFVAVAPDLFHRQGDRWEGRHDDMASAFERMGRFDDEACLRDLETVIEAIVRRPEVSGGRIGVLGFCLGGRMAYSLACTKKVDASVVFYGVGIPGEPLQKTAGLACPLLMFFAEKDPYAPVTDVELIRGALDRHGKSAEIVIWPGVDHGFFNDEREAHDPETSERAWARASAFLGQHLRG